MDNITLKLNKEEAVKILLNEFDEFKPSTWDEELLKGNRFENKEEFDFERKLFEDVINELLDASEEISLDWADCFIFGKTLYHFDELGDDFEEMKQDALFVCEERKLMIMNF